MRNINAIRFDLYSVIHKAQRKHLFDLSMKIGRADFRDASQVAALKGQIKAMVADLRKHADNEETFIHPLFQQIGTQGGSFEEGHHDLEILFEDLEKRLYAECQTDLYVRFNRFLTAYLTHIDAEETAQKDVLWKHYDDEALMDAMKKFQASQTLKKSKASWEG